MAATPAQARPFSPLLSAQLPGGSAILDRNLLAIKAAIGDVVDQFNRTVTFIGIGGTGGGAGPYVPAARRVNTAGPLTGGGALTADLTIAIGAVQALSLLGNSAGATGAVQPITLGNGLGFFFPAPGVFQIQNTSALFSLNVTSPLSFDGTSALSLLFDNASITLNGSNKLQVSAFTGDVTKAPGGTVTALVNIPNDTTMAGDLLATAIVAPATPGAGTARIYVDSTSKNLAVKNASGIVNHGIQSNAGTAHEWVSAIAADGSVTLSQPNYTDLSGSVPAITQLTGDATAGPGSGSQAVTVVSASGPFSVNGASVPANVSLVVGHSNVAARDHVQFFVASASLNNDSPDNTSLLVGTGSPTIASAQTLGIFSTLRVKGVTYAVSGTGTGTYNTAASLYVDGPLQMPPLGGGTGYGSTGTPGGQWGIYCATGGIFGDNITAGTQATAAILSAAGTAGTAFTANGNTGPSVSFFGVATAIRQTGGAATAGSTYTATEQGMINRMYTALRTYGLLT